MATTAQSVADVLPRRRARRRARSLASAPRRRTRRCTRSPMPWRRAAPRSSRPTRATWRPAPRAGCPTALLDRLELDRRARIRAIADGARQVAALEDPVGELIDGGRLANGLELRKVRVPLGVVAIVYEARPNVTIDAAALCLKSGNACVLRGSSSAAHSNAVLAGIAAEAAERPGSRPGRSARRRRGSRRARRARRRRRASST